MKPSEVNMLSNVYYMLSTVIMIILWVYLVGSSLNKILKNISLMTKKKSKFYTLLRKFYWGSAKLEIRNYITRYCKGYTTNSGYTVETIMRYEIDRALYKDSFVICGYDKLFLYVTTKMEEIGKFTYKWRLANEELTSEEMLQLYLNETKP